MMLDTALDYVHRGWSVFPLKPRDKTPLTAHGFLDASKDETQVKSWWTKHPEANIGIATGDVSGGLVVIDVDIDEEDGKHGDETFADWQNNNGCFIDSLTAITGGGGKHYYFQSSEAFPSAAGYMPDIDIRANGGYVVAPGSIHPNGRPYYFDDEDQQIICVQDDSDVEFFLHEYFRLGGKSKDGEKKKKFEVPDKVTKDRNTFLTSLQGKLASEGIYTIDEIKAQIRTINQTRCEPPLSDEELERTIFKSTEKWIEKAKIENDKPKTTQKKQKEEEVTEEDLDIPTLEDFEEREKKWLISGYIPEGCVTLLCSDGGIGKTSIWCDTLAALTSGRSTIFDKASGLPFQTGIQKNVMYFSKEDPTEEVLKAKLREAGAVQKNIRCIGIDDPRINKIWYGSLYLEKLIDKFKPDIVVFDTLQAFLPDGVDMAKRKDMRDALNPLNQLGAKYGTAFLLIMHTNKSSNSGRQRMADSSDIWDLGRSALMAGRTREEDVCYISHEKCNYGRLQKTILFSVTDSGIEYKGTSKKKDRDYMAEGIVSGMGMGPKQEEAKSFIIENLEDGMEISKLEALAKDAGISQSTLRDARAALVTDKRIKVVNTGFGPDKKWRVYTVHGKVSK